MKRPRIDTWKRHLPRSNRKTFRWSLSAVSSTAEIREVLMAIVFAVLKEIQPSYTTCSALHFLKVQKRSFLKTCNAQAISNVLTGESVNVSLLSKRICKQVLLPIFVLHAPVKARPACIFLTQLWMVTLLVAKECLSKKSPSLKNASLPVYVLANTANTKNR